MSDHPRPLLLSYLRVDLLADEELAEVKKRLTRFAWAEGYALGTVFVEQPNTESAAFEALVEAARQQEAAAVVVPGLHHFAFIGSPSAIRDDIERHTGARVLTAMAAFT